LFMCLGVVNVAVAGWREGGGLLNFKEADVII